MKFLKILMAAITLGAATTASAAVVTYADRTAFNAAATSTVTDTYEDLAPTSGLQFYNGQYNGAGYTITDPGAFLHIADSQFYGQGNWGLGDVMVFSRGGTATFTFAAPITALGIDLFTSEPTGGTIAFNSSVVSTILDVPDTSFATSFFGFTSTIGFSSFTINAVNSDTYVRFSDLTFGAAGGGPASVSEPAMLGLIGLGALALAARRRRRTAQLLRGANLTYTFPL